MASKRSLLVASILAWLALPVFAHRPYERPAGTFQRADGTVLAIVEHCVDGMEFYFNGGVGPVSIQFRSADGTEVARTDYVHDVALSRSRDHIDVYRFRNTFFPLAERVQRFDGHSLSDITSSTTLSLSPFVHTGFHWKGYLVGLGVTVFFVVSWVTIGGMRLCWWVVPLRGLYLQLVILCGVPCLMFLLFGPLSQLVFVALAGLLAWVATLARKRFRQSTVRSVGDVVGKGAVGASSV